MTVVFAAASLMLAGGAGMMTSLMLAPVRGAFRLAALLMVSALAMGAGLLLIGGPPEGDEFLLTFLVTAMIG